MRILLAQNTFKRFKWELDVCLTNIYSLDPKADVVILFAVDKDDDPVVNHIIHRWGDKVEIHAYKDTRHAKSYVASTRPFLWYCYLTEDSAREQDTYFQIDSDVIFRRLPDWSKIPLSESAWAGSDCASYLDANYIKKCKNGDAILDNFARILKVDRAVIEAQQGAGAQWILAKPTAEYWLKVQSDCHKLSGYLDIVDSDIQRWCAEMWAQLFNAPLFGARYEIHDELRFCWPGTPIEEWENSTILHNTGVTKPSERAMLIDKNKYIDTEPYGEDFSWVSKEHCGWHYINAINMV